jgi:DNA-binding transcriptional ArsR family regulator
MRSPGALATRLTIWLNIVPVHTSWSAGTSGYNVNQMVKRGAGLLDATFGALADPTRRAIVERLSRGEATVGELAEPFDMSLPAVSKHLSVLERAGLVVRMKDGRMRHCRLIEEPMRDAFEWIGSYGSFWEGKLDSLGRFLNEPQSGRRD